MPGLGLGLRATARRRKKVVPTTYGPELLGNGTFPNSTGLTLVNSSVANGELTLATGGAGGTCTEACAITAGKTYEVSYDIKSCTSVYPAGVRMDLAGGFTQSRSFDLGKRTERFTASASTSTARLGCGTSGTAVVDNWSIREVLS